MTKKMAIEMSKAGTKFVRTNPNGVEFYYEVISNEYSTTIVRVNRTMSYKGSALVLWNDPSIPKTLGGVYRG